MHRAYYVGSVEDALLEIAKQYVESQHIKAEEKSRHLDPLPDLSQDGECVT